MRRVSDITIQVEDRFAPPQAKPAPRAARSPAKGGRQPSRRRGFSPFWWKKAKRVTVLAASVGGVAVLPLWLFATASGQHVVDQARQQVIALSARAGFRVEDILVEGRNRTPRDEILAALRVERGDPMFGIDLTATRQRLEEISWVKTATIERRLPNEVHLIITERAPIVMWQNQGHYYLVDREGQVVGDEIEEYSDLPLMVGEGAPDHAADLVTLLQSEPDLQKRVKAAQWVGERRWNITLDRAAGGIEVRLPEEEPQAAWHDLAKLDREQQLLERQVGVIDMRLPDRLVLRATGAANPALSAGHGKHKQPPGKDA